MRALCNFKNQYKLLILYAEHRVSWPFASFESLYTLGLIYVIGWDMPRYSVLVRGKDRLYARIAQFLEGKANCLYSKENLVHYDIWLLRIVFKDQGWHTNPTEYDGMVGFGVPNNAAICPYPSVLGNNKSV
jgi:hypothetical protein